MSVVLMFPGLGSEYPELLARQCAEDPQAAERLADWRERLGVPLTDTPPAEPRERELARQMAIHAVNLLAWERHGAAYPQAAVCGHSLGFYAAAVAAGALDADASFAWIGAVFERAWARFEHDRDCVYVLTARDTLDGPALAAAWGLELLAVNGPCQIVVYGAPAVLEALCAALAGRLVRHGPLGSCCPFHSVRMAPVCVEVAHWLAASGLQPRAPQRPLWSHLDATRLMDAEAVRATLITQPQLRVRWDALIGRLAADGHDTFVELGPNRILAQAARWIVPGSLTVLSTDSARRIRRAGSPA